MVLAAALHVDGVAAEVPPALAKMRRSGMIPTSVEQALLELAAEAGTPEFKALQQLLKRT